MDKEKSLKNSPLFKGVGNAALSLLIAAAEMEEYKDGDLVFNEGAKADKLFIVAAGAVNLIKRMDDKKGLVLIKIEPFEEVEINCLMDNRPYYSSATAVGGASVVTIAGSDLFGILEQDPVSEHAFLTNVIREQSDTLRRINDRFREFLSRVIS